MSSLFQQNLGGKKWPKPFFPRGEKWLFPLIIFFSFYPNFASSPFGQNFLLATFLPHHTFFFLYIFYTPSLPFVQNSPPGQVFPSPYFFLFIYLLHSVFTCRPKHPPARFSPHHIIFFLFIFYPPSYLFGQNCLPPLAIFLPYPICFSFYVSFTPHLHLSAKTSPWPLFPPHHIFFFLFIFYTPSSPFGQNSPWPLSPLIHFFHFMYLLHSIFTINLPGSQYTLFWTNSICKGCKMANAKTFQRILPNKIMLETISEYNSWKVTLTEKVTNNVTDKTSRLHVFLNYHWK